MMHQNKENFYSIIIPSFNRADEIRELLASITQLEFPTERFEVIVADDGSIDTTADIVEESRHRDLFTLYYYTQKNQGPGSARNMGVSRAKGNFFIFVDSDVTVPPEWLTEIDTVLQMHPADAFGGPDTYRKDFPVLLKAINYSMTSFITTGGLRGKKGKKMAKFYPRSFNMGVSRELWQQIGGFGSLRHGQDIEFSNRIIRSGARVAFIEKAKVFHKRRTNFRRFFRQVFNWGMARINLYKVDKSMLEPLHALPALATLVFFFLGLGAFFSSFFLSVFTNIICIGILLMLYSMIDAMLLYKDFKPALLLPVIIPAQIFGYGMGFIYNFFRRVIFKKGELVGFKKHYYK
jgi:glycosyltransferase involved in cell wall biosynthesis